MINFSCKTAKGTVYVKVSEGEAEARKLVTLAREVRIICADCKRTGLWIAAEFEIGGSTVLVTNLDEPIEIGKNCLALLRMEVLKYLP